jgi:hypothetical protein
MAFEVCLRQSRPTLRSHPQRARNCILIALYVLQVLPAPVATAEAAVWRSHGEGLRGACPSALSSGQRCSEVGLHAYLTAYR